MDKVLDKKDTTNNKNNSRIWKIVYKVLVVIGIIFIIYKFYPILMAPLLIPLLFFGCLFGGGC